MRIAAAQDAPVFLDRDATTDRALVWMQRAAEEDVELLAFGETYLPGYPFWLSETHGSRFEDADQQRMYARYLDAAVELEGPQLARMREAAGDLGLTVVMGLVERAPGGGSVYCSIVVIHPERGLAAPHRKLVPTYEERLAWTPGDGHGLRAHEVAGVRMTTLNCWENWMPLARHACWAAGSQIHVAIWPGAARLTRDITRFAAREGRVFVLSAGAVLSPEDLGELPLVLPPRETPYYDGGSAIAGPDGEWIVEPVVGERRLVMADVDVGRVAEARQSFDASGHYGRPDVFDLRIDRRRRVAARFVDDDGS